MKDIKKSFFLKFLIILSVFFADQLSKYYVVSNFQNQEIETHLTSFLNIYLIWNNGIAFGLLGFEDEIFCSSAIAGLRPEILSTFGFSIRSKNCRA